MSDDYTTAEPADYLDRDDDYIVHGTWEVSASDEEEARERVGDGILLETSAHEDGEACETCAPVAPAGFTLVPDSLLDGLASLVGDVQDQFPGEGFGSVTDNYRTDINALAALRPGYGIDTYDEEA